MLMNSIIIDFAIHFIANNIADYDLLLHPRTVSIPFKN